MKKINSLFKNIQTFSFLFGASFGAAIGLSLFSFLVPDGIKMSSLYHAKVSKIQETRNKEEMRKLYSSRDAKIGHDTHMMSNNPYVMGSVTSEEQFLRDMKLHHEAAIVMSQQVLALPSLRKEVKDLASGILSAQTGEIKLMTDLLAR